MLPLKKMGVKQKVHFTMLQNKALFFHRTFDSTFNPKLKTNLPHILFNIICKNKTLPGSDPAMSYPFFPHSVEMGTAQHLSPKGSVSVPS